ncbi:MAG: hypothetical protein IVW36_00335 [Dehalococcoidia bacterium]|nr:hypothetical protein [Dehalococcoidia bacterium]
MLTRAPDAGGSHLDAHAERGADAAHAVPGAPDARGSHVDVLRADDQEVPASTEGAAITTIDLPAAV